HSGIPRKFSMYSRSFNTAREQNYWRPLYQLKLAARQGLDGIGDYAAAMASFSLLSPNCPSMARDHFDWNRRGMANSALGGKGIVCGSREGRIIGSQIAARSSIPLLKPNLPHRPQQLLHIRRLIQRIHLRPHQYSVLIDDERRPFADSRDRQTFP